MGFVNFDAALASHSEIVGVTVVFALIAHQLFRKYETFNVLTHAALLIGPPALATLHAVSSPRSLSVLHALSLCYTVYFASLLFSIIIYRVSPFHPLARYPGPFWARVTKLHYASVVPSGKQHLYVQALHKRYGDIVRLGPNELSFNDASMIQCILGNSGVPKGPNFKGGLLSTNVPMVGIQETDEHLHRRRAWLRGLGPSALKEYELIISKRTRQLVERLEELKGAVLLGEWLDYWSYDFMSDMAFGGGSEQLAAGDAGDIRKILAEGLALGTFFSHVPWLGIWIGHIPPAVAPIVMFNKHGQEAVVRRMARGSTTRDLFHYLNNEDTPDKPAPPPRQLVDDGILAVVAGSDTTASVLTSIFFCLLTNPETYATLQAEIDRFYPKGEDGTSTEHHRDMPYINAVMQEALRLFPPVITGSSRQVPNNSNGHVAGNIALPPGTLVYLPPWVIHRDARNFSFPESFWPERWLVAAGTASLDTAKLPSGVDRERVSALKGFDLKHDEDAMIAFSYGPMNCVGKGLAMQEMRTVLCALMQRFDFHLEEGWNPKEYEENYLDYFVATRPPLPVVLTVRA